VGREHAVREPNEALHVISYGSDTDLNIIIDCGPAERRTLFFNLNNRVVRHRS
jgi:hypothetical protein